MRKRKRGKLQNFLLIKRLITFIINKVSGLLIEKFLKGKCKDNE